MKNYYYSLNGKQFGPVSFDDLKIIGISKNTLIWREGLDDWQKAGDLSELSDIIVKTHQNFEDLNKTSNEVINNLNKASIKAQEIDNTKMFKNAFLFKGRARRSEFWLANIIFLAALIIPFLISDLMSINSSFLSFIFIIIYLVAFWFILSERTRRCHDIGEIGLCMLIPFFDLWMLFKNSESESNKYGNNPKKKNS